MAHRSTCPANAYMSKQWEVCSMILGGGTVDRTVLVRYWPPGDMIHVPYVSLAATDGTHRVVIDTGAREVDTVAKPHAHRYPEEELAYTLKHCMGWALHDVDMVINSHLHYDHCGGNHLFPNAKFFVQRGEWRAAWELTPNDRRFYDPGDYSKDRISYFRWEFLDGEEELLPGLRVIPAPGHTHGSQIILLDTAEGVLCFPGDAIPTQLNMEAFLQPAIVVDDRKMFQSMQLIRRTAHRIVFSHDDGIKTGIRNSFPQVPGPWER